MKKSIGIAFFLMITAMPGILFAQAETAPVGGNAMSANRDGTVPVNYYTGIPSISVPLYKYSGSTGLSLNLSLDYFAGGIRTEDQPSTVGLGWNLNVGGVITRTVRGLADDQKGDGYLYTAAIQDDSRSKVFQYYNTCTDAEQDIYQFNVNGMAGRFYIGKNGKITPPQGSHVRISMVLDTDDLLIIGDQVAGLRSFTITTDEGIKYIFDNIEYQTSTTPRCGGMSGVTLIPYELTYGTAWYLSKMVAPYSTDTISFSYISNGILDYKFSPQSHQISSTGVNTHSDTSGLSWLGGSDISSRVPSKIRFPDSTSVEFIYSQKGGVFGSLTAGWPILTRIKIADTAFMYGYMLKWDTLSANFLERNFLLGINYYTNNHIMPGYTFNYNNPHLPLSDWSTIASNVITNKKDHWGFYNGLNPTTKNNVPSVSGIYTGADRTVNSNALASTISSVTDPSGGTTYYNFENNDVLPVSDSLKAVSIDASTSTSNTVNLNRAHSTFYSFRLTLGNTFARNASPPVTGAGNLTFSITSTNGLTTYYTTTLSLKELYYNGTLLTGCVLQNGTYLIKTSLASGTTASTSLPITINWFNQRATGTNAVLAGGIRIKQITHYDPLYNKRDTLVTYRYVTSDGKSSGMGGQAPIYNYTTYQLNNSGGVITAVDPMQNILSDPANFYTFAEPSFVGYKRVEVIKGSLTHNLGKEVYEYTGVDEGYINTDPVVFPYMPRLAKDWAAGTPKRVLVYDSLNTLIQQTCNTYDIALSPTIGDTNYRSLKFCRISTNSYVEIGLERAKHFIGEFYFPPSGKINLTAVADTFYHPDGSITASSQQIEYDPAFNVKKVTTDYDKTRGLILEKRRYYSYNYINSSATFISKLRADSISVPISEENWITGDGNPRLVSGRISTFGQIGLGLKATLRPNITYMTESNKPIPQGTIGMFDSSQLVRNSTYFIAQDTLSWDKTSLLFQQAKDKRTRFTNSVITGYNKRWPMAKVSNSAFGDIAYNSFETADAGNWTIPAYTPYTASSITGRKSFPLSAGTISKGSLTSSLNYYLSYWIKNGSSVTVSTGTPVLTDSQNGWDFYTLTFSGTTTFSLSGSGWIDELRLHPKDANMVSYTYNALGQVTSTCDANNTIVYNYYDSVNRVVVIRDKDLNVIKKYEYPNDVLNTNTNPVWVDTLAGFYSCESDEGDHYNTGWRTTSQVDNNPLSESYKVIRQVRYDINYTSCPLPPTGCGPDLRYKFIGGGCELACRENISSNYLRITDTYTGSQVYKWVCTWRYKWSDGSVSPTYTENNDTSCMVGTICGP